jgi:outer membrane protein assembly factor BamB
MLREVESPDTINILNSYASPTGVWRGDRVVFHFGLYGTFCLNAKTGERLWSQNSLVYDDNIDPGSSIKCADGVIVVPCDGMGEQFVAGLSLETGREIWRTARPPVEARAKEFRSSYSTPLIVNVDGRRQAVVPGTQCVAGYEIQTGKEIWRIRHGDGFSVSATPIECDGKVILSTSYGGNELMAIDPTGSGDVTQTHVLWRQKKGMLIMPSPILVGELLYTVTDKGIAHALSAKDGELIWRERLGGNFASSPFASGDRILVGDQSGNVTVFRAGQKYEELGRYSLNERILASPVPIGDDLIIRTEDALYRFSGQ